MGEAGGAAVSWALLVCWRARMVSDERAEENQGGGSLFLCLKGIWKGSDGAECPGAES